ncbi:hypothetical protein GQ457_02G023900 [Hibiscus cannabinus]
MWPSSADITVNGDDTTVNYADVTVHGADVEAPPSGHKRPLATHMQGVVLAFPDQYRSHTCCIRDRPTQLCIDRKAGWHSPQPREWLRLPRRTPSPSSLEPPTISPNHSSPVNDKICINRMMNVEHEKNSIVQCPIDTSFADYQRLMVGRNGRGTPATTMVDSSEATGGDNENEPDRGRYIRGESHLQMATWVRTPPAGGTRTPPVGGVLTQVAICRWLSPPTL